MLLTGVGVGNVVLRMRVVELWFYLLFDLFFDLSIVLLFYCSIYLLFYLLFYHSNNRERYGEKQNIADVTNCVGLKRLMTPASIVAAYTDKKLNMELGMTGDLLREALEKSQG